VSHSVCYRAIRQFVETRPHFLLVSCVAAALRPTNAPMHGFASPTLAMPPPRATTVRADAQPLVCVAQWLLQDVHTSGHHLSTVEANGVYDTFRFALRQACLPRPIRKTAILLVCKPSRRSSLKGTPFCPPDCSHASPPVARSFFVDLRIVPRRPARRPMPR